MYPEYYHADKRRQHMLHLVSQPVTDFLCANQKMVEMANVYMMEKNVGYMQAT